MEISILEEKSKFHNPIWSEIGFPEIARKVIISISLLSAYYIKFVKIIRL